jgi:hypothetical protein
MPSSTLAANLQGLQVERPVLVALEGQRIHTFAQLRELVRDRGAAVRSRCSGNRDSDAPGPSSSNTQPPGHSLATPASNRARATASMCDATRRHRRRSAAGTSPDGRRLYSMHSPFRSNHKTFRRVADFPAKTNNAPPGDRVTSHPPPAAPERAGRSRTACRRGPVQTKMRTSAGITTSPRARVAAAAAPAHQTKQAHGRTCRPPLSPRSARP